MRLIKLLTCLVLVVATANQASASIVVQTSDFIANSDRSHFNGFTSIPNDGSHFTGGSGPYVEDSIQVQQINGDSGNDIWVGYDAWAGAQGSTWYADGGDTGYTQISLAGGTDFQDVGFNYGSGFFGSSMNILYELVDNGITVLSGSAVLNSSGSNYLGFSGGGFDTIRIRDSFKTTGTVTDHSFQALAVDSIETHDNSGALIVARTTPEPTSLALLTIGGLGAFFGAFFKRRANRSASTLPEAALFPAILGAKMYNS